MAPYAAGRAGRLQCAVHDQCSFDRIPHHPPVRPDGPGRDPSLRPLRCLRVLPPQRIGRRIRGARRRFAFSRAPRLQRHGEPHHRRDRADHRHPRRRRRCLHREGVHLLLRARARRADADRPSSSLTDIVTSPRFTMPTWRWSAASSSKRSRWSRTRRTISSTRSSSRPSGPTIRSAAPSSAPRKRSDGSNRRSIIEHYEETFHPSNVIFCRVGQHPPRGRCCRFSKSISPSARSLRSVANGTRRRLTST